MRVLITGAGGQLGGALQAAAPPDADVVALDSLALDICDVHAIEACFLRYRPDVVINAAAYTAVDRAELEEDRALAVNGTAVGLLAAAARPIGARLVHISTDFVFGGTSGIPYLPNAPTDPLGAYGRTKYLGEQAAGPDALIVRTAWVYAPTGGNFVRTMLRLMAERPEVRVVADQIGTPTYAPALAQALWILISTRAQGMHHYTDSGTASWYDFAVAIQEEALSAGLLTHKVPVIPITTRDFPTPARRPHYSVLDKSDTYAAIGGPVPHWRTNLRTMIAHIQAEV